MSDGLLRWDWLYDAMERADALAAICKAVDPDGQLTYRQVADHVVAAVSSTEKHEELRLTCVDPNGTPLADPINLLSFGAGCKQTMTEKGYYRDPRVQRRIVTTTRSESPWMDVPDDELARAVEEAT